MIAASLFGIAVISAIILNYQNEQRLTEIRTEGVSLVGLLGRLSYSDLVSPHGSANVLEALVYASSNDHDGLLYAAVVDSAGTIQRQASQSGVFAPPSPPRGSGAVAGEHRLTLTQPQINVIEFHGPLLDGADPAGYVRVGYEVPGGLSVSQLPFLGTLALIVFALTTLIYLMFRREIEPIHELRDHIAASVDSGSLQTVTVSANGEMAEFMRRFNAFVGIAQQRIQHLEDQESRLVSDKQLMSYRRSRIERVLDSLPEGILVMDDNGAVTLFNAMAPKLLGVDPAEIRDAGYDWSPDPALTRLLHDVRKRCRGSFTLDPIEIPAPGAVERTLEVAARPVLEGDGAVVVVRDITQETLARRSRGEFVAHVAHELKTPLNTLMLYSEGLQGEDGADANFRLEATNVISDEVERLADLIGNLLSLTKIENGSLGVERTLVKPRDLLMDVFENARRGCRNPDIVFEAQLPAEMNPIHADKDMLRVAINNLLTNAIKYNRPDGSVTLVAEETADSLVIEVRDTGIGIAPDEQTRIFEKFYRSESDEAQQRTGHGLGLALARDIVQIHNGLLEVTSEPGVGSRFRIVLWKDTSAVRQAI